MNNLFSLSCFQFLNKSHQPSNNIKTSKIGSCNCIIIDRLLVLFLRRFSLWQRLRKSVTDIKAYHTYLEQNNKAANNEDWIIFIS